MSFFTNTQKWPLRKLVEICTLKRGYDLPVTSRTNGSIPIYAANGQNGTHDKFKIKGPGVVTGRSGTIGRVHYVEENFWPLNTSLYVTDFHDNHPKWVYYMLSSFKLERFVQGAGVPTLNRNLFHEELVPLPPFSEQKRIAAILDKADSIRRKRQQAIELADEFLRAVFLDMFGDPVTNPKGIQVLPMTDCFDITTGKLNSNAANEGGKYPFFTCAKEVFQIDDYAFDQEALLLAGNNANAEYDVKHYKGKFNAYQRTYVLSLKNSKWSYPFFKFALEYQLQNLKRSSKGSNTKYITMEIMSRTLLPAANEQLQNEFVSIYQKHEKLKKSFFAAVNAANKNFEALSLQAFSGKL